MKSTESPPRQVQLWIGLKGIAPPIWRRVLVPADLSLDLLHHVIQIGMPWEDYHLHMFRAGGREFMVPHPENSRPVEDEREFRIEQVLPREGDSLEYWYDFGDDWMHEVRVEHYLPGKRGKAEFRVLGGARAAPPEDSGGPHGYQEKLDIQRRPGDFPADYAREMIEWLGEDHDAELFDRKVLDIAMQRLFRRR